MTDGSAADWARRADTVAQNLRADEIDRRALAGLPGARDALEELGARSAQELRTWRDARLAELRASEPAIAAAISPRGGAAFGHLVATLGAGTAYALFFSRGQLGVQTEVVASAVALGVATGGLALATRTAGRNAVTARDVTVAWILTVLAVVAAIAALAQAGSAGGMPVAGGIALAFALAMLAMAVLTTARRLRAPVASRAAREHRVAAIRAEFGAEVARVRADAVARIESVLAAAPPEAVAAAAAEIGAAYEILRDRGRVGAAAKPHRPGLLLVDVPVGNAARSTGMPDEGRLVPALAPTT
ncbi:hypothetical protein [Agromyces marinus]|uniref:Uncharacterized protein n=1 Tax=Agromyces marinus TaxID=1389020 RepID=A0ABN6YEB2_9MICO|nr:hypothetical protein [Agromyces marinus]UIP59459.1 hypothetical protein DSM26151_23660 [Agromyces marinus]BDZ55496.1 hypothetical protein GCM10025870_25690 [Agromyces marinus]